MSHVRRTLATIFLALSGVVLTSSPAMASEWTINGTPLAGVETISMEQFGGMTLESTLTGGVELKITCSGATSTGEIKESTKDTSEGIKFTGCKVVTPTGCKVSTTLTTQKLKSALTEEGGKFYDKWEPASGTTLITIAVTECEREGSYKLSGTARCEIEEPGGEAVQQFCSFTASSGSSLKFGTAAATFLDLIEAKLAGANKGEQWGIAQPGWIPPKMKFNAVTEVKGIKRAAGAAKVKIVGVNLGFLNGEKFHVTENCLGKEMPACEIKVEFQGPGLAASKTILGIEWEFPVGSGRVRLSFSTLEH